MNVLTWAESTQRGVAAYNNIAFGILTKPALSFAYDGLYYEDLRQMYMVNGEWLTLVAAQKTEIENFISEAFQNAQTKVLGIDATNMFIGWVAPAAAHATVPYAPPTPAEFWLWNMQTQQFDYIHAVDANGIYLGNIATSDSRYKANAGSLPPNVYDKWDFTRNTWVDGRTLSDFQTEQAAQVGASCAAAIVTGVTSSALGAPHTYPTKLTDQANMTASVMDSVIPANASNPNWTTQFWCEDAAGNWNWSPHTAAQIQQAGTDVKSAILGQQSKNAQLQAKIAAVGTEPVWAAGLAYAVGAKIQANGWRYTCTTAGVSGAAAPVFPQVKNATVTDNGAVWTAEDTLINIVQSIVWS